MKDIIMKSSLILLLVLFFVLSAISQHPEKSYQDKKEQVEALRVSFITQRLNLTREEAQQFWPVYNEYRDTKTALRKERMDNFKSFREKFDALSEKELTDFADSHIIYRQRDLDIMKKYHAEFKSVLPIKKVALLYRVEEEFKSQVMKQAQGRK